VIERIGTELVPRLAGAGTGGGVTGRGDR
jgi:hypothetical protein